MSIVHQSNTLNSKLEIISNDTKASDKHIRSSFLSLKDASSSNYRRNLNKKTHNKRNKNKLFAFEANYFDFFKLKRLKDSL